MDKVLAHMIGRNGQAYVEDMVVTSEVKDQHVADMWLHQGMLSVDDYFKELDTLLIKVDMHESDDAKMARFVSGIRREIQDVVELHEYSSLETLVHLAIKVESQIARKNYFKNSHKDGYYHSSWKIENKSFSKYPSKDSTSKMIP